MDISQFVSETIKQICIGIKEAKEACKEKTILWLLLRLREYD